MFHWSKDTGICSSAISQLLQNGITLSKGPLLAAMQAMFSRLLTCEMTECNPPICVFRKSFDKEQKFETLEGRRMSHIKLNGRVHSYSRRFWVQFPTSRRSPAPLRILCRDLGEDRELPGLTKQMRTFQHVISGFVIMLEASLNFLCMNLMHCCRNTWRVFDEAFVYLWTILSRGGSRWFRNLLEPQESLKLVIVATSLIPQSALAVEN